ncbi:hypothetical protein [Eleftheria terrae]|uniref:hypothetical protein n=1 Tax=Eleftheria terrae TaxID=1597781 RepID=UPI00263B717A|nr:hypothetical protein [Eleftheria terrae]WKB50938.1 hypothetical protein N7L95_14080 [Eleftheria terrae]
MAMRRKPFTLPGVVMRAAAGRPGARHGWQRRRPLMKNSNCMFLLASLRGTFAREILQTSVAAGRECRIVLQKSTGAGQGSSVGMSTVFPLRSLPAWLDEIPERFSSSSLPPSFAPGRFAAFSSPACRSSGAQADAAGGR